MIMMKTRWIVLIAPLILSSVLLLVLVMEGASTLIHGIAPKIINGTAIMGIRTPLFWITIFRSLRTIAKIARQFI